MKNSDESPNVIDHDKGKDNNRLSQLKGTYLALYKSPKTMKQVAVELNIDRANVCRYLGRFRLNKSVELVRKGFCPITKHRAGFYTTNSELFPPNKQLKLFKE